MRTLGLFVDAMYLLSITMNVLLVLGLQHSKATGMQNRTHVYVRRRSRKSPPIGTSSDKTNQAQKEMNIVRTAESTIKVASKNQRTHGLRREML